MYIGVEENVIKNNEAIIICIALQRVLWFQSEVCNAVMETFQTPCYGRY